MENKLTLVLMVGPPASGKSTFGEKYASEHGMVYISTDKLRAELGMGESDQTVSALAFAIARKRVNKNLGLGKSVMLDATNINPKARKDWINIAREHEAHIKAFVFEVDREELIKRDGQRNRHVGELVIDKFLNKYHRPDKDEVDEVIVNPKP